MIPGTIHLLILLAKEDKSMHSSAKSSSSHLSLSIASARSSDESSSIPPLQELSVYSKEWKLNRNCKQTLD